MIGLSSCSRRTLLARSGSLGLGLAVAGVTSLVPRLHAASFRHGETSDREVLTRAVAAWRARGGGVLQLERGRTYDLGPVDPGSHVFDLRGLSQAVFDGNGATLQCTTAGHGKTQLFLVRECSDLRITGLTGQDRGASLAAEWRGMDCVHIDASGGRCSAITLQDVRVDGAVSLLSCSGGPGSPRASGIRLLRTEAHNCYYGLSFQENGDEVTGDCTLVNCRRAYFPYGVRNHNLALSINHDGVGRGANACILIKRYLQDTRGIRLQARFTGVLAWQNLVKLETQPPRGEIATISDVDVRLGVDASPRPGAESNLVGFGTWRDGRYASQTRDVWRGIRISGCGGGVPPRVAALSEPVHPADIVLDLDRSACI